MAMEEKNVGRIKLGSEGLEVSAQGLGCMGMSAFYYGPLKPESDMIQLIHHAINSGVTLLDTSDVYGPYTNEILLGKSQGFIRRMTKEGKNVGRIKLGSEGLEVSVQGLGCLGMSDFYGPPKPEPDMIELIHHAINSGITFFDTSNSYGPYTNEILLGKALKGGMRERIKLATKFGIHFADGKREVRGEPAYVRAACEASLKRLDVDCIDLYYQHRIDTRVPIEVTVGELKKLVEEGKIKYIGLSEASASTIRRAHAVHPITAVQLEWSLWSRDVEEEIIPTCSAFDLKRSPTLQHLPRFQGENLEHNKKLYERICQMAAKKGCTPAQLALAWVHHQGNDVCPIPGTTKIENFNQNIEALSIKLTSEDMAELESIASADAVQGDRYGSVAATYKDSETPPLSAWKAT
ncbi:hypothetical protein RDI58_023515 [Solanum bulbocastanum]|uniref:NADP-dependent oxidoreductase domain-containing protein n=1 Tax=Solanum bulbocastanum TaxID=147425 RepID=A0AAN8Y777_SOLBU